MGFVFISIADQNWNSQRFFTDKSPTPKKLASVFCSFLFTPNPFITNLISFRAMLDMLTPNGILTIYLLVMSSDNFLQTLWTQISLDKTLV